MIKDLGGIKDYVGRKLCILERSLQDCKRLNEDSEPNFYESGLESEGVPSGECVEDIYSDGFDNGVLEGERNALIMLHILMKDIK